MNSMRFFKKLSHRAFPFKNLKTDRIHLSCHYVSVCKAEEMLQLQLLLVF